MKITKLDKKEFADFVTGNGFLINSDFGLEDINNDSVRIYSILNKNFYFDIVKVNDTTFGFIAIRSNERARVIENCNKKVFYGSLKKWMKEIDTEIKTEDPWKRILEINVSYEEPNNEEKESWKFVMKNIISQIERSSLEMDAINQELEKLRIQFDEIEKRMDCMSNNTIWNAVIGAVINVMGTVGLTNLLEAVK